MQRAGPFAGAPRFRAATVVIVCALLLAVWYGVAEAHDHGTLRLASKTFRAGDSVAVTGAKFTRNDGVTLALVGVNGRVVLADVPTDSAGAFRRAVLVPGSVSSGSYRLVAEAVDGDEVASVDVVVISGASNPGATMPPMSGMDRMPAHEGMQMGPTGAPLALERARSTAVTTAAAILIIACAAAGLGLLRGSRSTHVKDGTQ